MIDLYNEGKKRPVVEIKRGQFTLFNRYDKALLYDEAKKQKKKSYWIQKSTFNMALDFKNQYLVDEAQYRQKKLDFLTKRTKEREFEFKPAKTDVIRDKIIMEMAKERLTAREIAQHLTYRYNYHTSERNIQKIVQYYKEKEINSLQNEKNERPNESYSLESVENGVETMPEEEKDGEN